MAAVIDPFSPELLASFSSIDSIKSPFFPGLYVFYDSSRSPLYLGQSGEVRTRIRQHARSKKWFSEVASVEALIIADSTMRLCAEAVLQLRHRPRYCQTIKLRLCADGSLQELQFLRAQ